MGIIKCPKCATEIRVTPVKTVTLDDLEHIKKTEPGAYELCRDLLNQMAHLQSQVIGKVCLAYNRGSLDPHPSTGRKKR